MCLIITRRRTIAKTLLQKHQSNLNSLSCKLGSVKKSDYFLHIFLYKA